MISDNVATCSGLWRVGLLYTIIACLSPAQHFNSMADQPQPAPAKPTLPVSTAITATDHGRIVVLAGWLCLAVGTLLSMSRVYVRWPLNVLAGKDDIAYAVSFFLAAIQTAVTINAVGRGFGRVERELEDWQVARISKVRTTFVSRCSTLPKLSRKHLCRDRDDLMYEIH